MNKNMYLGIIAGAIISIILINAYKFSNPSMVSVVCSIIGCSLGVYLDNKHKKK